MKFIKKSWEQKTMERKFMGKLQNIKINVAI
jgi:hypothetical protein